MRNPLEQSNRNYTVWDLMNDFTNWFDRVPAERGLGVNLPRLGSLQQELSPAVDIEDKGDHFLMSFDMPGVKKEDINIDLQGQTLTVRGKRERQSEVNEGGVNRIERQYGSYVRSFTLPEGIDPEKVEAAYENGVLELAVPKAQIQQKKQIQIGESLRSKPAEQAQAIQGEQAGGKASSKAQQGKTEARH